MPWFQAGPIHSFLGSQNITQTLARVRESDKASLKELVESKGPPLGVVMFDITTPNWQDLGYHEGKSIYVNEPGLYKILFGSTKPFAEEFQHLVCTEILPTIRRTGQYSVSKSRTTDDRLELAEIEDKLNELSSRKRRREIEDNRLAIEVERLAIEQKAFADRLTSEQKSLEDRLALEQKSLEDRTTLEKKQREGAAYRGEIVSLQEANFSIDERIKIHCRDFCVNAFFSSTAISTAPSSTPKEICITQFLRDKGLANKDISGKQIAFGRKIADLSRDKFGQNFKPPQKTILCNGQSLSVNSWTSEHSDLIEAAWLFLEQKQQASASTANSTTSKKKRRQ